MNTNSDCDEFKYFPCFSLNRVRINVDEDCPFKMDRIIQNNVNIPFIIQDPEPGEEDDEDEKKKKDGKKKEDSKGEKEEKEEKK